MDYVGYIVHYAGERDGGAYVPALVANAWVYTAQVMLDFRPGAILCIEQVTEIPEWGQPE